jgi:alpha-glucosidase
VTHTWLQQPYSLDGWRVDVANMSGRTGHTDVNGDVSRALREVINDDSLLVAEHNHDYRSDISAWHGAMNYAGFTRPVWTWLRGDAALPNYFELPVAMPLVSGDAAVSTMRAFRAGVPWEFVLHSWALLDSHDSARFRTVAGSRERQLVGIGLQMTTPGVPMMFAGDELGLEGAWGEDARRTMPWDRPEDWDAQLFDAYRSLIALRRSSSALSRGSLRYVFIDDDVIAYLRETRDEALLCLASRASHDPVRVPFTQLETLYGADAEDGLLPADGPSFHVWKVVP